MTVTKGSMGVTESFNIGFVPLVDAALVVAAVDEGIARAHGVEIVLHREVSWANMRDKLHLGRLDAAHMLAPAAIAMRLGFGRPGVRLGAPLALGLNGNAVTVSRPLAEAVAREVENPADPAGTARAVAAIARRRRAAGEARLAFGIVYPYSTHLYQLRLWLRSGGADPDEDVDFTVVPPPLMAGSLGPGGLDGFCVGAPWSSLAEEAGSGVILHAGVDLVRDCPEKLLVLPQSVIEDRAEAVARLVRALVEAAEWCANEANRTTLAGHLARPDRLGAPADLIARVLAGRLRVGLDGRERGVPDHVRLDPDATVPRPGDAALLLRWMREAGHLPPATDAAAADAEAAGLFRQDLYEAALAGR